MYHNIMWTIKSRTVEKNLQAKVPGERLMLHVKTVWENGDETVEVPFPIENIELMEQTILSISDRLNNLEVSVEEASKRPIIPEKPVPPVQPEPTEEELRMKAIAEKEQEIAMEVERIKREKEIAGLALEDAVLAQKIAERDALKSEEVIKR